MPADETSPLLSLPLIQPAQAQKHVTHNEALRLLDVLVQPAVASRSATLPPEDPAPGARYIPAGPASGAWTGLEGQIVFYDQGSWQAIAPQPGWQVWVSDEDAPAWYSAGRWQAPAERAGQAAMLGINTPADAINRLAVAGPASLLTHQGAGHQLKINKALAGDTASLLFQTGWSGRAELGTTGSDDLAIRVSADGSSWASALSVSPAGIRLELPVSGAGVTQSATDATPGRLMKSGDNGWPVALALTAAQDLDLLSGSSVRLAGASAGLLANHYPEAGPGALWQIGSASGGTEAGMQMFLHRDSARLWCRSRDGAGSWLAWKCLSAQSGSNANGSWLRLGDGSQICQQRMSASAGAASTWTYPQPFVTTAPRVTGTAEATVLSVLCLDSTPGLSSAGFSLRGADNARRADTVQLLAVGRWY